MLAALAALITLAALAALALPLWRGRSGASAGTQLAVYRAQLAELERDEAAGLVPAEEAASARLEIQRRLLKAAGAEAETPSPARRGAAIALVVFVIAATGAVYLTLGRPDLPARPLLTREDLPRSGEQWLALGQTMLERDRMDVAVEAFGRAVSLLPNDPGARAALGEAMTHAADDRVTNEALAHFEAALRLEPRHPTARYYVALQAAQAGQWRTAHDLWLRLAAESAPDAPWWPLLREKLQDSAAELGIDPPALARGPTRRDIEAAQQQSEGERTAMIRAMVEGLATRLEQQPDDFAGWLRLGRAWIVLGERDKARAALDRAAALRPGDADVKAAQDALR